MISLTPKVTYQQVDRNWLKWSSHLKASNYEITDLNIPNVVTIFYFIQKYWTTCSLPDNIPRAGRKEQGKLPAYPSTVAWSHSFVLISFVGAPLDDGSVFLVMLGAVTLKPSLVYFPWHCIHLLQFLKPSLNGKFQ